MKYLIEVKFQLCLLLFSLNYLLSLTCGGGRDEPFLDPHVTKERKRSDTKSLPFHRETQLYSRSSRSHLRIHGKKIDALGRDGDKHAKLVIESDNFGRVRIRGALTNHYLCIKRNATLIGRKPTKSKRCVFYEKYAENHFTEFISAYNMSWVVAVSRQGRMRPGHKGRRGQKTTQFIDRASKIVIQTKDVRESLYHGLREHIELLLRKYRAQEGNNKSPRKMPSPGIHESKKRNNRKGKKGKKMKQRSQKKLLKMLRTQQEQQNRELCVPC